MGRRRKKVLKREEEFQWPFEINDSILDIVRRSKPKVAFLSGCPREYYPDDPGYSKFGITFCHATDDVPLPRYYPSEDRLEKPISTIGYGIGGLLAPRFAKDSGEDTPGPAAYQNDVIPPPVKKVDKVKRESWTKFVERYEQIAEERFAHEASKLEFPGQSTTGGDRRTSMGPNRKSITEKTDGAGIELLINSSGLACLNSKAAFGMTKSNPRFSRLDDNVYPGAGTYEPTLLPQRTSFQITDPQGRLIPSVRLACLPRSCDYCMGCGIDLMKPDYYQTKDMFKVSNKLDEMADTAYRLTYLSLCRQCYCKALKEGYEPWRKERIPDLFVKKRHCNCFHDHKGGYEEYLTKTSCKSMLNLVRKELIYGRSFKDNPCKTIS